MNAKKMTDNFLMKCVKYNFVCGKTYDNFMMNL